MAQPIAVSSPKYAQVEETSDQRVPCSVPRLFVIGAALAATVLKLYVAFQTFGTNDVISFLFFGRNLASYGLAWTYGHEQIFNHPPLTAYFLEAIYSLHHWPILRENGVSFAFLLRLPGIFADLVVVVLVWEMGRSEPRLRLPLWALLLFALSPVSLMVSGFHGNIDGVMVMFLALAGAMLLWQRPIACGVLLALSCQIKIVGLIFVPIFCFYWIARRASWRFVLAFATTSMVLLSQVIIECPALYLRNVLCYSSYWGGWGLTYILRATGFHAFGGAAAYHIPLVQDIIMALLKLVAMAAILVVSWRRRQLDGVGVLHSIALAWMLFFVFASGVGVQYMVWLAPFVLLLSPGLYACLTAAATLWLFQFYNVTAGGWPWYKAISTVKLSEIWAPWSLASWVVLIAGLLFHWRNARRIDPRLRVLAVDSLPLPAVR